MNQCTLAWFSIKWMMAWAIQLITSKNWHETILQHVDSYKKRTWGIYECCTFVGLKEMIFIVPCIYDYQLIKNFFMW
jgi:hypothetical protein